MSRLNSYVLPIVVLTYLAAGASLAQSQTQMVRGAAPAELTPGQAAADWMQSYGARNKECLEWTDTCVNCVRAQSGDNFNCSNIGIACQPKDVICVRRADDKTK